MSSDAIVGGEASKTKHKWSAIGNQSQNWSKQTMGARPNGPVPLISPSDSFSSEDDHQMLKISLSSISKLEVRNLKRKLRNELDEIRSFIKRFDPDDNISGSLMFRDMKTDAMLSNKKLKTGNGGKKGLHGADKGTVQIFKTCNNLLTKLMKHKFGWIFNIPVDVNGLGLHDYHTIVKEPMDLGTVKTKLGKSLYQSPLEFADDVRLTFNNATLYNPKGHEVHHMAEQLLKMFEEKWIAIEMQYDTLNRKLKPSRDVELPGPASTNAPSVEPVPAPTPSPSPPLLPPQVPENRSLERAESMTTLVELVTTPEKPEEEEAPVDRDLTLEEKRRLSEDLQDLPYDKLETVVQIIKKRNPELSQQDDEIELDIDSVDVETLWELYVFVTGSKASMSKKNEEQEFGSERDAESVHNIIQEPVRVQ